MFMVYIKIFELEITFAYDNLMDAWAMVFASRKDDSVSIVKLINGFTNSIDYVFGEEDEDWTIEEILSSEG